MIVKLIIIQTLLQCLCFHSGVAKLLRSQKTPYPGTLSKTALAAGTETLYTSRYPSYPSKYPAPASDDPTITTPPPSPSAGTASSGTHSFPFTGSIYTQFNPQVLGKPDGSTSNPSPAVPEANCAEPPLLCQGRGGKYRTADGTCNNANHPTWGAAGRPQRRLLPAQYLDGRDVPRIYSKSFGPLPSPRIISQNIHSADSPRTESSELSHFFTVWGQFLDHDLTHTPIATDTDGGSQDCCNQSKMYPTRDFYYMSISKTGTKTANQNCFPITVNSNDRFFNSTCLNFVRSKPFAPSATCQSEYREQGNTQTSFVDASQVYGASEGTQHHLRTETGGLMKSSPFDLLPENSTTACTKRPNSGDFCFGSGDPRVNEHPMLSSLHTVFHRLHNQLANKLAGLNPHWNDELLFQEARKIQGAIMQKLTYGEYLPLVLGGEMMSAFNLTLDTPFTYDPNTDPRIFNSFSTAAFRFGHSMINGKNTYGFQKLDLRNMFFHTNFVQFDKGNGLNMVLDGLCRDHSQKRDRFMNLELTDHLFQSSDGRSLDLASLNIQRGRDHGLPPYNAYRKLCGLPRLQDATDDFEDAPFIQGYKDLEDVDLFTGGLSETPVRGGVVGPTFACLIGRQFHDIKFGDKFWYQNTHHEGAFTPEQIATIDKILMSDILCWTSNMRTVQQKPFITASFLNTLASCSSKPPIDLSAWAEAQG